ncbi:MAG: hypothetical protein E5X51_14490 [Mesorhizobium sp.]|uniref:hypothetical protein n=1 Tax=Mesorhizobium sp. TaxID=1871066 RepID=UPI0011FFE433|nr:hypothetical protein [Mesorhizobium sp.]TIQ20845.1 MAG: hypothetical protein E5X51_14490 [Mesorhizobium sp.]
MARKLSIAETLRRTSDQLKRIRKHVANGGHVDQMQEVDALVGLAKEVADRQLAGFEGLQMKTMALSKTTRMQSTERCRSTGS